jgi:gamma-glutamyltranspeptidase/glutathione hydrolase
MRRASVLLLLTVTCAIAIVHAGAPPVRSKTGMVISASEIASQVGAKVLKDGGNAIDAVVATAFALAVTHPTAGNIGGGGFLLYRSANGDTVAYDFRETAPSRASPDHVHEKRTIRCRRASPTATFRLVPGNVAGLPRVEGEGKLPWT